MNAETETYSRYIRKQIDSILAIAGTLNEDQLNRRPPLAVGNSVFVIATHVLGNAQAWVLGVACGQPVRRDRPSEFASSGSFDVLKSASEEVSGAIEAALATLEPGALDQRLVPPQELWGEGEPYEISVRTALADVLEHASIHLGQVQLTRDLVLGETST